MGTLMSKVSVQACSILLQLRHANPSVKLPALEAIRAYLRSLLLLVVSYGARRHGWGRQGGGVVAQGHLLASGY